MRKPYWMRFLAPDDGGAAVVMPAAPAADAAPTAAQVEAEMGSFEPPNLDAVLRGVEPTDAPKEKPEPDTKKAEAKKPDQQQKPPEKKPGEKPTAEPPAKQLREELERTRRELEEFRGKADQPHPKVKELETTLAEIQKERDTLKQEREQTQRELEMRDPLANAKLREADAAFNQEYARSLDYMPELDGKYHALVQQFIALPRGNREEYTKALGDFEQQVEELVGQRKFGGAMDLIRKGHDFVHQRGALIKEIRENSGKLAHEARTQQWSKHNGEVSEALGKALEVPEDIETSDPFSPLLYVSRSLSALPEEKQKELASAVDGFTRKLFAGAKPRTAADFPGMDEKQIRTAMEEEGKWHEQARPLGVRTMKQGLLALAMMRPLVAELSRLRERVAKQAEATPPDPTNPGARKAASDDDDIANYQAPEIRI